jgi:hypothetical protein
MGLENNNFTIYLSIGDGKITRRVKEPTANSKQRTTKEGKVVNEEIYDAISGLIIDIKVTTHPQYGKFWNIFLQDGEDVFCLQTNYSGSYASAFLKQLPNVDLSQRVRLIPSMKIKDGKKKPTLFINQHGKSLKHFYTKDDPNGLPEMVQKKFKGNLIWDDGDMMEFLEQMVNEKILPKLPKGGGPVDVPLPDEQDAEELELEAEAKKVKDRLPF